MQSFGQMKELLRLFDAAAQHTLGSARVSQAQQQSSTELQDRVGLTVGERELDRMPGAKV